MKPAPFAYCRPDSVAEAVEVLGSSESSRVLAGGQSLIPAMNFRLTDVSVLVDIRRIGGLDSVTVDADGVTVGAAATQSRVLADASAARAVPGLRAALRHVGHLQIRNRGTVCGSLAHADPAAELPAVAVATDARIRVTGAGGRREIAARDFFCGPFWTALEDGELVTEVWFPVTPPDSVTVVDELARRAGDFAVAGLVAMIDASDGAVRASRLVGFGVGGAPLRLSAAETALAGWSAGRPTADIEQAAAADCADAFDDIHATSWYRREAAAALVLRAARTALTAGPASEPPRFPKEQP